MRLILTTINLLLILGLVSPALLFAQELQTTASTEQATPTADTGGIAANETVLWDIRGEKLEPFRQGIAEALAADAAHHLLSEEAFREWVKKQPARVPNCYQGVSDCVAPGAILFDALGLSSLLRVELSGDAATWSILDSHGQVVREGTVSDADPRKRAFGVVREIFDATGVLSIESEPPGATVEIDGRSIGTTPLTYRVGVGEHRYTLRHMDHQVVEGSIEVVSGRAVKVSQKLPLLAGTLVIVDAPENADVFVNGGHAGKAGAPINLAPGNYTIEVRAEGFETLDDAVTVEPGMLVQRSAPLQKENPFLRDISSEAIIFNNYILRFGLEFGLSEANFQDSRSGDDNPVEFAWDPDEDGEVLGAPGVRLDAAYGLKNFGIVLLSMSYLARSTNIEGTVTSGGTTSLPVTVTGLRRLQLRPFQVFYRHFYKNFVPFMEGGIGINFQWLNAEGPDFTGPQTLRRTDALWTLAVGGQYYFNENVFGMLRYSYQDYFERGLGSDHQFSFGLGAAFPNLFGFDTEPPEQL